MRPQFEQGRDLLKQLQDLTGEGRDETPEAERIRAEMDVVWPSLDRRELALLKGLSADLYMLSGDELPDPEFAHVPKEKIHSELREAYERQQHERVLELLRYGTEFPPERIAYLRARCWEGLGDARVALWFMDHAERTAPRPNRFGALVLDLLLRLDLEEEAVQRAERFLRRGDSHLDVCLRSIEVLYTLRVDREEPAPAWLLELVVESTIQAIEGYRDAPQEQQNHAWALVAVHAATHALTVLGRHASLDGAYQELVSRFPTVDVVWAAYGMDSMDRPDVAGSAFDKAIQLGTRSFWPHRHRALRSFERKEYQEALVSATKAFDATRQPSLRAEMLAYAALASHGLGRSADIVGGLLQRALELDPANLSIENLWRRFVGQRRGEPPSAAAPMRMEPRKFEPWSEARRAARESDARAA